jgi:hypothetical protein
MAKKTASQKARDKANQAANPNLRNDREIAKLYGAEGVNAGNALINKFAQEGSLGRVSTSVPGAEEIGLRNKNLIGAAGMSDAEKKSLATMEAGLGGYTSPEYQAQREQMQRGINSNTATSMAQLARGQARGKVYGAAATAQSGNLIRGAQNQKDNLEQDLMIKNIDEMRSRNESFGKFGAETNQAAFNRLGDATNISNDSTLSLGDKTLEREKINLGQANAEKASQVGLYTGASSTALQKAQQKMMANIQKQGIAAINGGGRSGRR